MILFFLWCFSPLISVFLLKKTQHGCRHRIIPIFYDSFRLPSGTAFTKTKKRPEANNDASGRILSRCHPIQSFMQKTSSRTTYATPITVLPSEPTCAVAPSVRPRKSIHQAPYIALTPTATLWDNLRWATTLPQWFILFYNSVLDLSIALREFFRFFTKTAVLTALRERAPAELRVFFPFPQPTNTASPADHPAAWEQSSPPCVSSARKCSKDFATWRRW